MEISPLVQVVIEATRCDTVVEVPILKRVQNHAASRTHAVHALDLGGGGEEGLACDLRYLLFYLFIYLFYLMIPVEWGLFFHYRSYVWVIRCIMDEIGFKYVVCGCERHCLT